MDVIAKPITTSAIACFKPITTSAIARAKVPDAIAKERTALWVIASTRVMNIAILAVKICNYIEDDRLNWWLKSLAPTEKPTIQRLSRGMLGRTAFL